MRSFRATRGSPFVCLSNAVAIEVALTKYSVSPTRRLRGPRLRNRSESQQFIRPAPGPAVLTAAGTSMDRVVKATVFLKNISDFQSMNEVYAKFFPGVPPARTVQAVLPND